MVDVKLDLLDIEQCPSDFYASNAFMGTARCDYESTYVSVSHNFSTFTLFSLFLTNFIELQFRSERVVRDTR